MEECNEKMKPSGWKVSLSIAAGVLWLIFIILWLAFYAGNYSAYKNFAIILISILVLIVVVGTPWATWAIRFIPPEGKKVMRKTGFTTRVALSIIIPLAWLIFLIYWFFFIADAEWLDFYKNLAVFLVSILAIGGILGIIWSSWGTKHGKEFDEAFIEKEK